MSFNIGYECVCVCMFRKWIRIYFENYYMLGQIIYEMYTEIGTRGLVFGFVLWEWRTKQLKIKQNLFDLYTRLHEYKNPLLYSTSTPHHTHCLAHLIRLWS